MIASGEVMNNKQLSIQLRLFKTVLHSGIEGSKIKFDSIASLLHSVLELI